MHVLQYRQISPEHNGALIVNSLDIWQDDVRTRQFVAIVRHPVIPTRSAQML